MAAQSQLVPQNENWYEDLPPASESFKHDDPKIAERMNTPSLDEDLGIASENFVEVSRTSSLLRGMGIMTGGFMVLPMLIFMLVPLARMFSSSIDSTGDLAFAIGYWIIILTIFPSLSWWGLRIDTTVPRDTPVRFNRHTGKVYTNEFKFTWNPFGKWPASIKVVDWSTVKGEITKQSGYNGKAYVTRYALVLASCKPGTNEVVERIQLKGNMPTTLELYQMWRYIGLYMKNGLDGLPTGPVRDRRITFLNSFFEYMPYLNPTAKGRTWWKDTGHFMGVFLAVLTLPVFWILLPAGIGHYIAMKLAPESKWPPEIDAESRS